MVIAVTGGLLGWKKDISWLHAGTISGTVSSPTEWQSSADLRAIAIDAILAHDPSLDTVIARIDIRPSKGTAKVIFDKRYYGVQIDLNTGDLLTLERRNADLVENIHDGSIVDMSSSISFFKLLYTSILALSLLGFTLTGFWLWVGPKVMRRRVYEN